jgi:hypothetical protein
MEYLKINKKIILPIAGVILLVCIVAGIIFFYPKINKTKDDDTVAKTVAALYAQQLNQARIKFTEDSIRYAEKREEDSILYTKLMAEIAILKDKIKNQKVIYEKQKSLIELDDVDADITDLRRRLPKKGN